MLSIVETNPFKQLTHLGVGLTAANDAGVKRYLAQRLATARSALAASDAALQSSRSEAARLRTELTDARACVCGWRGSRSGCVRSPSHFHPLLPHFFSCHLRACPV